ncbi:MAG: hypothetical protein H6604_02620 [Flavobacteriales bacterium]|nr:hypothetical protein [Flavobacteriales bacterium]
MERISTNSKKFYSILFVIGFSLITNAQQVSDDVCNALYKEYEHLYHAKKYKEAFPSWEQTFEKCPTYTKNIYGHGDEILTYMIQNSTGAEQQKYKDLIVKLYDVRVKSFDDLKLFNEGEKYNKMYTYQNYQDPVALFKDFSRVFKKANETDEKMSGQALYSFFNLGQYLYSNQGISVDDYIDMYFDAKTAAEKNIEIRSNIIGPLVVKEEGIKDINGNDSIQAKPLSLSERKIMDQAKAYKDYFVQIDSIFAYSFNNSLTKEAAVSLYEKQFEEKKKDTVWVANAYSMLKHKDATDLPIYDKVLKKMIEFYPPKKTSTGTVASTGGSSGGFNNDEALAYSYLKKGQYSSAISSFNSAIANTSNSSKQGELYYYLAYAYFKSGNLGATKSNAIKAARLKAGYGAPYILIAQAYAKGAGSCGSNTFEKKAVYWAAADMAAKAGRIDGSVAGDARKTANYYNSLAPSSQEIFTTGKKKGQTMRINCWINETVTIR